MSNLPEMHTIVRHSGYGYGGDGQFIRGLETRQVKSAAERDLVLRVKGMLFARYAAATNYADVEMYRTVPVGSFTPRAPGSFSSAKIDGLDIYVPPTS